MSDDGYTLYGDIGSGSAAVELVLAEIGATVRLHDVPLENESQRGAGYTAINAQRKLPTLLTPDGDVLTESAAILLYLAERYPEAHLMPAPGSPHRSAALRWLLFIATELYPLIEIIDYPERFLPEDDASDHRSREATRTRVRGIWKRRWLIVESNAAGATSFLASGFSVLDPYVAVVSRWAQLDDWRRDRLPRIEGIARAVAERRACGGIWARHFGPGSDALPSPP